MLKLICHYAIWQYFGHKLTYYLPVQNDAEGVLRHQPDGVNREERANLGEESELAELPESHEHRSRERQHDDLLERSTKIFGKSENGQMLLNKTRKYKSPPPRPGTLVCPRGSIHFQLIYFVRNTRHTTI